MSYVFVENFAAGLDTRKPPVMGEPGTLIECSNCHISRGEFVESRKSIVPQYTLPAGKTKGMLGIQGRLMVFGTDDPTNVQVPANVLYQQLTSGTVTLGALTEIIDAEAFDGRAYVIAAFDDGTLYHFYDGEHVTQFDEQLGISDTRTFEGVARTLAAAADGHNGTTSRAANNLVRVTGQPDGTAFTIAASVTPATNGTAVASTTQNPVPRVPGATSSGGFDINTGSVGTASTGGQLRMSVTGSNLPIGFGFTSISVNGIELLTDTRIQEEGKSVGLEVASDITTNPAHGFTAVYRAVQQTDPNTGALLPYFDQHVDITGDPNIGSRGNGPIGVIRTGSPVVQVSSTPLSGGVDPSNMAQITVAGIPLLEDAVFWTTTADQMAADIASAVTAYSATSGFIAAAVGPTVTITSVAETDNYNGQNPVLTLRSGLTAINGFPFSGGVDEIPAVVQISQVELGGTFIIGDVYTITIDGTDFSAETSGAVSKGRGLLTHRSKMHVIVDSLVRFSALGKPLIWDSDDTTNPGAGFINLSNNASGSEILTGLGIYNGNIAALAPSTSQIWFIDEDEQNNRPLQTLQNTGCVAPRTVINFSDTDTFYLDRTGVRSLRSRDSSGNAFSNDVGTAIDDLVSAFLLNVDAETVERSIAVVEPLDKRIWFIVGTTVFVFSYFRGAKISAWSTYDTKDSTGATDPVEHAAFAQNRLYLRSGDIIKVYGGEDGSTYPAEGEIERRVQLPFLDAGKPATTKTLVGVDYAVEGDWRMYVLTNPNNIDAQEYAGIADRTSYAEPDVPITAKSTHFAPVFESDAAGHLKIFNCVVHYKLGAQK